MTPEEIKTQFPSICYNCKFARKPAADSNRDKGYVGCSYPNYAIKQLPLELQEEDRIISNEFADNIYNSSRENKDIIIGEGWVDLRSSIFGESSGIITNFQLLTKRVTSCPYWEPDKR